MLTLVCFAVKEEGRFFSQLARGHPEIRILLTGMGRCNAEKAVRADLAAHRPGLVVTSGFAGGLRPELELGTVLFDSDGKTGLERAFVGAGAQPAHFHCAERVAITAAEKRALRETTKADAVEMESAIIDAICKEQMVPTATVRVILDTAQEDLPLDFNRLLTEGARLDKGKLALALLKSPAQLGSLLRLQKRSELAGQRLAEVLRQVLLRDLPASRG